MTMRLAIAILVLAGCSSGNSSDEPPQFEFEVEIWDVNDEDTLVSPDGVVLPDVEQFFKLTTVYPTYEDALAGPGVTVAVMRGGVTISEYVAKVRDCEGVCSGSCDGLGTILFQNMSLRVDSEGIIAFSPLDCWECNGTIAGAQACH